MAAGRNGTSLCLHTASLLSAMLNGLLPAAVHYFHHLPQIKERRGVQERGIDCGKTTPPCNGRTAIFGAEACVLRACLPLFAAQLARGQR